MSNNYNRVYAFTNENVSSYEELYDFNGAKVLSVLGSGDQFFSSLLFGAKEIVLYDSNPDAWLYFVLKFYSIKTLSYEEFWNLSILEKFDNRETLERIFKSLPKEILDQLTRFLKNKGNLNKLILYSAILNYPSVCKDGRMIPYFDKERYYVLQNILKNRELPRFYLSNIMDLPNLLGRRSFNLILTSNIYDWLSLTPEEYLNFLKNFRTDVIQAYYTWNQKCQIEEFTNLGFKVDEVKNHTLCTCKNNFVISKK